MANITFTIDDTKLATLIDAIKWKYPIPPDENGDPLFTNNAWAKEVFRKQMIAVYNEYERQQAIDAAAAGVTPDDEVVS